MGPALSARPKAGKAGTISWGDRFHVRKWRRFCFIFFVSLICLGAEPEKREIGKEYEKRRAAMVQEQLVSRGIRDSRILKAMGKVPREIFLRPGLRFRAYMDEEVPVEKGLFLPKPYEGAKALELLAIPSEARVLVLDPGTGYVGALVSQVVSETAVVVTAPDLVYFVQDRLGELGYSRLIVRGGSLSEGWPEQAPFDRIFISGVISTPLHASLFDQLTEGGHLLAAEGKEFPRWVRYSKSPEGLIRTVLDPCHFPPAE